jgi:transcription initiation factor TFIIE subunit alpha
MKVSNQLIKDVVSEVAGEDAVPIAMVLKNQINFSEFKVAEALKMEIKDIRKALYKLLEYNLVSFRRKKDKKKGWYIYYWTFNNSMLKYLYSDIRVKKLEKIRDRLIREESNNFFLCPNRCVRLDFDKASEFEYRCPECGTLLDMQDNSSTIKNLKEEIIRIEAELKKDKLN